MTRRVKKNNRTRKSGSAQPRNRWGWLNTGITVALVGVIGAVLAAILPRYIDTAPPLRARLEVDSVVAQSYAEQRLNIATSLPGYETLDFKLRNTGNELAFVTGIRIVVKSIKYSREIPTSSGAYVPLSASYGLVMPVKRGTFVEPVSEEVAPGQPDRFRSNISLPKNAACCLYTYHLDLALIYNKNDFVNAGSMPLDLSPGYIDISESETPPPALPSPSSPQARQTPGA